MMNPDPIRESLEGVFRQVFEEPALTLRDDMTAADVARWDSLSHIQMIVTVEKLFMVKFKNIEIARLKKVGDLVKLVGTHRPDLVKKAS
jgi:acyl carrier protein